MATYINSQKFIFNKNEKEYDGYIIKKASYNEFGTDLYVLENNYVVHLNTSKPIASYNVWNNNKINHIMTESDLYKYAKFIN